jgi:hypothetical protein
VTKTIVERVDGTEGGGVKRMGDEKSASAETSDSE